MFYAFAQLYYNYVGRRRKFKNRNNYYNINIQNRIGEKKYNCDVTAVMAIMAVIMERVIFYRTLTKPI